MVTTRTRPAGPGQRIERAGRRRVVVEKVRPEIDGGRFPVKRTVGETLVVEADVFSDGHDVLACAVRHRPAGGAEPWREARMQPLGNDRWRATFEMRTLGRTEYTVVGWVDRFETWRRDLGKRVDAGQEVPVDLLIGAELLDEAAVAARQGEAEGIEPTPPDERAAGRLAELAALLRDEQTSSHERARVALGDELEALLARWQPRRHATVHSRVLSVVVGPRLGRFSSWYELFPRSASPEPGRHGTFADVEARLPYVKRLGFDVLYLPPIHPIGRTFRKGPDNAPIAGPDDPGSPWAIGGEEGGHTAVHPALGTLDDFRRLVGRAREQGIEVALDIALQCSPDHPWVGEHPEWFRKRPDGTIQYAENPPKKYQDIYPFDFECEAWESLWEALAGIFRFWVGQGVKVFRVDNPHTKALPFWEWLIEGLLRDHPDVVLLSEAFTRPKVMYRLAKLGFTQSYTYFAWKNSKWELERYLAELAQPDVRDVFRPSFWPNTPDILNEYLQIGGRPAFAVRLVLAATLAASYGIYGPAFELCVSRPREPGSEEYAGSEKYEVRHWRLDDPATLAPLVARVNRIRAENPALHADDSLRLHRVDDEQLVAYSKSTADGSNTIVVVVNLDPHHAHAGTLELDLDALGLPADKPFQVHDLLGDARFLWHGPRNPVSLDPALAPAHVFRVRRRVRTERDFEYFL